MKTCCRFLLIPLLLAALLIFAGAADFTDSAQIKNDAAVAFMHDLGLVTGYTDGSFRPANNVQRSEAAKLAALICEASPAAKSSSNYKDVPKTHWAKPYIDYCTEKGIVSGQSGRFRPDGFVTGRELAKIMLACVGFDGKQYTGARWASAVDRDANTLGLYSGMETDPSAFISRDNACLMIYNAMQRPAVIGKDANGNPQYATDALLNPITYMEYRFGIVKFSGVVTGNEYADLTQQDAALEKGQTILYGHSPFPVSTSYDALGRTAELFAVRTTVGNDVFYSVIGLPALVSSEVVFSINSTEPYGTILRYSSLLANNKTSYYLNGNRASSDFLAHLGDDCSITGIDRDGDGMLDAVIAYSYESGTVSSLNPLTVSFHGKEKSAVAIDPNAVIKVGEERRCLLLGGTYYVF